MREKESVREKVRERECAIGGQSSGEEWTAFVNYLSKRVTWRTVKEIFQQQGRVIRVYIPSSSNKQNYRNHTFAFVQFAKEDGLMKVIANVNGIWIDGKKVSVGVTKYQKQKFKQAANSDVRREEDKLKKGITSRRRLGSESVSKLRDERSYKDALVSYDEHREVQASKEIKEGRPGKEIGLRNVWEMHIPLDEYDWVKRSLTGIIKSHFDLELVVKGLASDGIIVKGAKWGYTWNSCILTFDSVEELEKARSSRGEDLFFWFDWLDPLMSEEGVPLAFCSVELVGIPLLCWNVSFLEKLLSKWGKLVCIHESTIKREDMAVARALLKVASPFDIQVFVNMGSYGRSFKVKINLGSVSIKQESFAAKKSMVAGDGVHSNDALAEDEEDRHSVGVGNQDLIAEDSRDTDDRWLVGDNCTSMVGGKGEEHLLSQELQGQTSGAKMSESPDGILNFKGDYRGFGLRDDFLDESVAAQSLDSSEPTPFSPYGPAVNLINLGFGKVNESRLEALVDPQQTGLDESNVHKSVNDPSYLLPTPIPGTILNKEASSEEVIEEVRVEKSLHMGRNQGRGCSKETHAIGFNSWSPFNHLYRSLHLGRWNRGSIYRVYRRSRERKVWFNPSRENGNLQPPESSDHNRSRITSIPCNLPITNISERSPNGIQEEGGSSQNSEVDRSQHPRGAGDGVKEEALATWEVNKLLGISFKEGKKAFLDKIINLEKGLAECREGVDPGEGICKKEKSRAVANMVRNYKPGILLIQETKLEKCSQAIRRRIGGSILNGWIVVPAVGELLNFVVAQTVSVCIGGDFNVYLDPAEKIGMSQNWFSIDILRNFLNQTNLIDLPMVGGSFPNVVQSMLPRSLSDHNPVSLEEKSFDWGPKPFRFFNYLLEEEGLELKINDLEFKAQTEDLSQQDWGQLLQFRWTLWKFYRIEESIWFQKSRARWIKDGDRNTRFFYLTALNRSRRNEITSLKINGSVVTDPQSIKLHIATFFKESYSSKLTLGVEDLSLDFAKLSGKWEHGVNHAFITLIPKKINPESVEDFRPISLVGSLYKILSKVLSKRLSGCVGDIISQSQFAFILGRQLLDCAFIANEGIDYWSKQGLQGVVFKVDFRRAYDTVEWPILFRAMKEMGFGNRWSSWITQCLSIASISILVNGSPFEEFSMNKGLRQGCSLSPLLFNIIGEMLHLMLSKAIERGLFHGFIMGNSENSTRLSHLQFADDLIIFCQASINQIKNVKRVLRIFSIMTGLHLNLAKSKLFGINLEDRVLSDWAEQVGCSVGYFPTEYLGLPLGAKKNIEALWDSVFKNFSSKLAGWKASCLSLAGRTVLLKSVLTSLPIFFLSLFKMSCNIGKKLNSLMANFLWGDKGDKRRIHWVNWNTVCRPLNCGGLGVLDLNLTNRALLGKWVWKFANDKNSLWKSVLCSKQKVCWNTMSIGKVTSLQSSWILRGIANNFSKNDSVGDFLRSNSKLQIGNGKSISFWNDVWADEVPLKIIFLRIYVLSINKGGEVIEFGSYGSSGWEWNVQTRRNLSDWELDQWLALMTKLKDFKLSELVEDSLSWSASGDGLFSVKSCRKSLGSVDGSNDLWLKGVWMGFAPPRVEAFLWQLAHQKLAVKAELVKRGVSLGEDIQCPFCKNHEETVQHLFISCFVVWKLWNNITSFWDISLVLPQDPPALLSFWGELRGNSTIWKFIPGVIFWSIWKARNAMVFEGSNLDSMSLFFTVRFRLSKWFLAKFPTVHIQEDLLIGNPSLSDGFSLSKAKVCHILRWIPPPVDFLKMNVDGAARLDGSGGGILRDWQCRTLLTFSEKVGQGTPLAELKAIQRGIEFFLASLWVSVGRLIVECDCKSVVEWIQSPALAPAFYSPLVNQILSLSNGMVHSVRWIPRASNGEADSLAKKGIDDMSIRLSSDPQVIIQGLSESGLFASVIQSAQTTTSKGKFLSSLEKSNSSRVDESGIISSRKIGIKESTATARRIMEISEKFSYGSAIPPLPPPVLQDLHIGI
ncbi:hypothetical protein F3Y22_tig00111300pilonHSYRG00005 [Hibiscus syriacus]|uniref:RRM domain-containing protein n=1 Tax=Hibiscus syriacus TaxID=106335 RepID=A0A6A2YRB2_HIBSY|nr:hypothetical protein F3Y22_tig00111300pilonHSYRG00005 [Hibiscus syriacus]